MNTLEVLYAAKARLEGDAEFVFVDWTSCTCGHIYAAAMGKEADRPIQVQGWERSVDEKYAQVLITVAEALGFQYDPDIRVMTHASQAACHISDFTIQCKPADADRGTGREDAIKVIAHAIAAIEAQHEQDRLDVLAQAQQIVDNADVATEVTA